MQRVLVNVSIEFEREETATFGVLVANEGDETQICLRAERRAKELAHRFASLP
jgi:hypothetical protein